MAWLNHITGEDEYAYSHHYSYRMADLDYMKKFVKYLPDYISIELQNSFKEQIEIKKYLESIINKNL